MTASAAHALEPAVAPATQVALGGHSGAQVMLHAAAAGTFVRKTAGAPAGNLRLRQQATKQRLLAAQGFAFPAVRRLAVDSAARAFFEMDYIPARTLSEVIVNAVPVDRRAIVASVEGLIRAFANSAAGVVSTTLFHDKIAAIAVQADAHPPLQPHRTAIVHLASMLDARDWTGIPISPDHGDLTLENILVTPDNRLVFIDCDVAWVSSWWLDVAKLFQDLEGHWCLRAHAHVSIDARERLRLFARDFRAMAHDIEPRLPPRLNQLAALHLYRTLPYVQTSDVASFACAAALRLLETAP